MRGVEASRMAAVRTRTIADTGVSMVITTAYFTGFLGKWSFTVP